MPRFGHGAFLVCLEALYKVYFLFGFVVFISVVACVSFVILNW